MKTHTHKTPQHKKQGVYVSRHATAVQAIPESLVRYAGRLPFCVVLSEVQLCQIPTSEAVSSRYTLAAMGTAVGLDYLIIYLSADCAVEIQPGGVLTGQTDDEV